MGVQHHIRTLHHSGYEGRTRYDMVDRTNNLYCIGRLYLFEFFDWSEIYKNQCIRSLLHILLWSFFFLSFLVISIHTVILKYSILSTQCICSGRLMACECVSNVLSKHCTNSAAVCVWAFKAIVSLSEYEGNKSKFYHTGKYYIVPYRMCHVISYCTYFHMQIITKITIIVDNYHIITT
jgi:hypothetical protein